MLNSIFKILILQYHKMLVINAVQEAIMSPVSNDTTETETFPLYAEQKQHSTSISLQYILTLQRGGGGEESAPPGNALLIKRWKKALNIGKSIK